MAVFKGLFDGLVDLIYPKICLACKTRLKNISSIDNLICAPCWSKIKRNPPPFCRRCGRHLETGETTTGICPDCAGKPWHFDRAFSPCSYEGVIKELIHQFKYQGKDYLGATLGRLLVDFIREYRLPTERIDLIIPVPLHKAKLREREFNQAKVLSDCVAAELGKTVNDSLLIRRRHTAAQAELNEDSKRFLNVKGSFAIREKSDIIEKNILLIDDVFTTGATCSEAAYALKNSGCSKVFVLTLAN